MVQPQGFLGIRAGRTGASTGMAEAHAQARNLLRTLPNSSASLARRGRSGDKNREGPSPVCASDQTADGAFFGSRLGSVALSRPVDTAVMGGARGAAVAFTELVEER